ncbi:hypothetical protein [Streptomyces brasiliscabiei]|uniref:Uncharacterized protein n=1 Tax=Streptomyces brasiliscabiei TaxID=2736302 RepID=A0ABU8GH99_9ACTN
MTVGRPGHTVPDLPDRSTAPTVDVARRVGLPADDTEFATENTLIDQSRT